MFYKMKMCNKLKKEYERDVGDEYDVVTLCRPDLLFHEELPRFVLRNPDRLWADPTESEYRISDRLVVSSSRNIDYYTSIWDNLNNYWEDELGNNTGPIGFPKRATNPKDHIGAPERLVHYYINQSEIEPTEIEIKYKISRWSDTGTSFGHDLKIGLNILKEQGLYQFTRKFLEYICKKYVQG